VATLGCYVPIHDAPSGSPEKWPVSLSDGSCRAPQIIFRINHQFLRTVGRTGRENLDRPDRMSNHEEGPEKPYAWPTLAIVGATQINQRGSRPIFILT